MGTGGADASAAADSGGAPAVRATHRCLSVCRRNRTSGPSQSRPLLRAHIVRAARGSGQSRVCALRPGSRTPIAAGARHRQHPAPPTACCGCRTRSVGRPGLPSTRPAGDATRRGSSSGPVRGGNGGCAAQCRFEQRIAPALAAMQRDVTVAARVERSDLGLVPGFAPEHNAGVRTGGLLDRRERRPRASSPRFGVGLEQQHGAIGLLLNARRNASICSPGPFRSCHSKML